jgi:hypothetical protein
MTVPLAEIGRLRALTASDGIGAADVIAARAFY